MFCAMALEESMSGLPSSFDVVSELSDEALISDYRSYGVDMGKFVRFGPLIIVGPATPTLPDGKRPYHLDIAEAAYYNPDPELRSRVRLAADHADPARNIGQNYPGVMDAGHYLIEVDDTKSVTGLMIFGFSTHFRESVYLHGRAETGYLARVALSPNVSVQAQ
jgi:hypothetical protein